MLVNCDGVDPSIRELNLSNRGITGIAGRPFQRLSSLAVLYLNFNNIFSLEAGLLEGMETLNSIFIDRNPLKLPTLTLASFQLLGGRSRE